jgi:hypothetical protein
MMTGWQVGRTHHSKRRSRQHGPRIDALPQFGQRAIHDFLRRGRLDELDQRFYGFRVLDSGVHFGLLDSALRAKGFGGLALPGLKPRLPGGQHEDSAIS